jgi:hypothetical protein
MRIEEILSIQEKRNQKIGLSEERVRAILPIAR